MYLISICNTNMLRKLNNFKVLYIWLIEYRKILHMINLRNENLEHFYSSWLRSSLERTLDFGIDHFWMLIEPSHLFGTSQTQYPLEFGRGTSSKRLVFQTSFPESHVKSDGGFGGITVVGESSAWSSELELSFRIGSPSLADSSPALPSKNPAEGKTVWLVGTKIWKSN